MSTSVEDAHNFSKRLDELAECKVAAKIETSPMPQRYIDAGEKLMRDCKLIEDIGKIMKTACLTFGPNVPEHDSGFVMVLVQELSDVERLHDLLLDCIKEEKP